jgi:hypothetical protein
MKFKLNTNIPDRHGQKYHDAFDSKGEYLHAWITENTNTGMFIAMVPNTSIGEWGTWAEAVRALTVRYVVRRLEQ